jgi:uncharacterized damage-inducible protein DinB
MMAVEHYYLMAQYNQWMNQKLYQLCATIPDEERKKDRGAFFQSIHGTLDHILYGDKVWMGRFRQQPFSANINQWLYENFEELKQERERMDHEILEWTKQLSPDWLASNFEYKSKLYGKTKIIPAWILVSHLFNHQTHHRGQLTTLLTQLGYDYGSTDLPWMPALDEMNRE